MDKHRKAFNRFAEEALEKFDTVESVYLFGSVARGEHGSKSDVDILIEVENLSEQHEIENAAFRKATEHGVSMTPIVKEKGTQTRLIKEVRKEGRKYVRG